MYCNKCGKEIIQNSKFCNSCGNEIILMRQCKESEPPKQVRVETPKEYVRTCDYCGKEFETKIKLDNHERVCKKNPTNFGNWCPFCGIKNMEKANFCKKCGNKINGLSVLNQDHKKIHYYFEALKKYGIFKSRSTRKEYWTFLIFNFIICFILGFVEGVLEIYSESDESIFVMLYQIFVFIPSLAVGVRRMHDVNKSGWYLLVPFYNFFLTLRDGTRGDNKYGPDPKLNN